MIEYKKLCNIAVDCMKISYDLVFESIDDLTKIIGKHEVFEGDDILKVDRVISEKIIEFLSALNISFKIIVEEKYDPYVIESNSSMKNYVSVFLDPFDGSKLYQRGIPSFWASAISFAINDVPTICAILNFNEQRIYWCDENSVYCLDVNSSISESQLISVDRTHNISLPEAYLETYLMLPSYFFNAYEKIGSLIESVKCIIPNGGPTGFVDILSGKADIYIGINEAITEVYTALPIVRAGKLILKSLDGTDFKKYAEKRKSLFHFICTRDNKLMEDVLCKIQK